MRELDGKVAIITGAGSGIGRASALLFARHGAKVIASDVSDSVDDTAKMENNIIAVQADAGSEADVQGLVKAADENFGGLHIYFANAGIGGGFEGILGQSVEEWENVLRVNLIGPFLAVKHAGKYMADAGHGGSIICTASVAGIRSGAGGPAYSASKAGVINLAKVAAQQLATSQVRCNAICPGLTETGMTQPIYDIVRAKGKEDSLGHLNPLRRGASPEELAEAALFLASDKSSYVNGHALVVDGGLSSSHPVTRQDFGRTAV